MNRKLHEYGITIKESQIHIKSDMKRAIKEAVKTIKHHRLELINYIRTHPEFKYSLNPIKIDDNAPRIVKIMAESSKIAGVGPMASVAGALADLGVEAMLKCGARVAVVENGGEISIDTDQPINVTVISENPRISGRLGFQITSKESPVGIATSTGRSSHAISFGEADSVTIIADSASIADAAATAVCNVVVGCDVKTSIRRGLDKAKSIVGVRGAMIIRDQRIGIIGNLPKIIKIIDEL